MMLRPRNNQWTLSLVYIIVPISEKFVFHASTVDRPFKQYFIDVTHLKLCDRIAYCKVWFPHPIAYIVTTYVSACTIIGGSKLISCMFIGNVLP